MDPTTSYAIGPTLPDGWDSCWKRIRDATHRYPDSLALISMHQRSDLYGITSQPRNGSTYLRWKYRDLQLAGNRLAASLAWLGVGIGTPVFTFLRNGVEYVLAYWASSALGCTFVPLNVRQLEYEKELEYMVDVALRKCQSRTAIVFALDGVVAQRLDGLSELAHALKIVVDGDSSMPTWQSFESLLAEGPFQSPAPDFDDQRRPEEHIDSTIMFTSGTTSLPKGCHWHYPHFPSASFAMRDVAGEAFQQKNGDVAAITAPNNHAVGFFYLLMALCNGAAALFPGPTFEAETFLRAAVIEGVTHTVAVPTMIQSISDMIQASGKGSPTFKHVMIGGTGVSPEVLYQCVETLGSEGVEVIFGMTDGVFISSGKRQPDELIEDGHVSVGRCLPGCQIKICAPGSRSSLSVGHVGELHYSAATLIDNYIDRESDDFYYEDSRLWFCTGDQTVLKPDGRLFVTGRYKDMIIRGGENISPTAIETCIATRLPHLSHLQIQVVGAPDRIAGEVPVAVTAHAFSEHEAQRITITVSNAMGKSFALDEVIAVQELGLKQLPRTMAGKIQKSRLKDLISERYKRRSAGYDSDSKLIVQVKQVWARAVGLGVQDLSLTTELADLGDSITLMRVKDRLFKQTGLDISLQEIIKAKTLRDLVGMLHPRSPGSEMNGHLPVPGLAGPPNAGDMVHVSNPAIYKATKQVVIKAIKPHGLRWSDVRDVFPAYDMTRILARDGMLDRWSYEIAVIARKHGVDELASALLKTMQNNPMMASFLVWDDNRLGSSTALHVTVDQSEAFIKSRISYGGSLTSVAALKSLAFNNLNAPVLPGPLFHATIYYIEETHSAGMLYNAHHAVTDAAFGQLIFEDWDLELQGTTLRPHVPYKVYCDSLYALRDSPAAKEAVQYHVSTLRHLHQHQSFIWPLSNVPIRQNCTQEDIEYTHDFPAAPLHTLCRRQTHLSPSLVLKAAFTLVLFRKTNHTRALFTHLDSGRDKFPFLPASLAASSPKLLASDVGGPTLQLVTNLTPAPDENETPLQFLERLQTEQDGQHKYAAAPLSSIVSSLSPESAAMIPELASRCMFNFLGTDFEDQRFESFEVVGGATGKDEGALTVEATLRKRGEEVVLRVRGSVFGREERRSLAGEMEELVGMFCDESGWNEPMRMVMTSRGERP